MARLPSRDVDAGLVPATELSSARHEPGSRPSTVRAAERYIAEPRWQATDPPFQSWVASELRTKRLYHMARLSTLVNKADPGMRKGNVIATEKAKTTLLNLLSLLC